MNDKKRKRVPVSCLNCRRRKVKCDRAKPSCGGCVKNGVGHLCQFLEPKWAHSDSPKNDFQQPQDGSQYGVQDAVEIRTLKARSDKVIHAQRLEIEELKRQLAVMEQLSKLVVYLKSAVNFPITVLHKINPLMTGKKDVLEVANDVGRTIRSLKPMTLATDSYLDIYSWINIIRLDPNMTTLWFKITNMQKIYTMYKVQLVKGEEDQVDSSTPTPTPTPALLSAPPGCPKLVSETPLSKRKQHTINEVDFTTSSSSHSSHTNGRKCPVIECDFNFLSDVRPSTPLLRESLNTPSDVNSPSVNVKQEEEEETQFADHNLVSTRGRSTLLKMQNLWDTILALLRGNEKLNYKQMYFLIDFYFNNLLIHVKSREIFLFYKSEIQNVIRKNGNDISLNLTGPEGPASDEELFARLNMSGIYLCMLGLIVEETLNILRGKFQHGSDDDTIMKFKSLFPTEVVYAGLEYKESNILRVIQSFVVNVNDLRETKHDKLLPSLPCIAVAIALINREIINYMKSGAITSYQSNTFTLLKLLFKGVLDSQNQIALWRDPELITSAEGTSKKQVRDIRLHISYLWLEFVRIINLTAFNIVNLTTHLDQLNGLYEQLFAKIEEADFKDYHRAFMNIVQQDGFQRYKLQLGTHYLMNKIYNRFRYGINYLQGPALQLSDMEALMNESEMYLKDEELETLDSVYLFEIKLLLLYKSFLIRFLALLQYEENGNTRAINTSVVECFKSYLRIISFIQETIIEVNETADNQYLLHFINEMLTRLIQFIIGLIIRVETEETGITPETFKLLLPRSNEPLSKSPAETIKCYYLDYVTQTIQMLNNSELVDKERAHKLAKLWDFYTTFIKNSKKLKINYGQIHKSIQFETSKLPADAKCPVSHKPDKPNFESSPMFKESESNNSAQCPIGRIATPLDNEGMLGPPKTTGKCPIDHTAWMRLNFGKRMCPFDHNAYDVQMKKASISHIESNIRGGSEPKRQRTLPLDFGVGQSPGNLSPTPVATPDLGPRPVDFGTTTIPNRKIELGTTPAIMELLNMGDNQPLDYAADIDSPMSKPSSTEFVVDWNELNDFDFEFLKTEFPNDQFNFLQGDI